MRSMLNIKHVENMLTMQFQTLNIAKHTENDTIKAIPYHSECKAGMIRRWLLKRGEFFHE